MTKQRFVSLPVDKLNMVQLNYAVAIALGKKPDGWRGEYNYCKVAGKGFSPASQWDIAGPIIKRYGISVSPCNLTQQGGGLVVSDSWYANLAFDDEEHMLWELEQHGDSPTEAAMRVLVQYKLGDHVAVPVMRAD